MAGEHRSFATPNNNNDDAQRPETPRERQSNSEQQKVLKALGEIQLRVKDAWKKPEDGDQDAVGDKINKPTTNSRRKQSTWLVRTKRFCHEASVVGLRYVASPSASPFRRSAWVLLLLVGAAFTTYQIQDRIRCYLSRPVNVNYRIQHADEIRFPTVTVCNENRMMLWAAQYFGKKRLQCILR